MMVEDGTADATKRYISRLFVDYMSKPCLISNCKCIASLFGGAAVVVVVMYLAAEQTQCQKTDSGW